LDRIVPNVFCFSTLYCVDTNVARSGSGQNADFVYLLNATGLGKGNLSSHLTKLKEAGYITATKSLKRKYPNTSCALTAKGRKAFNIYRRQYLALAQHLEG